MVQNVQERIYELVRVYFHLYNAKVLISTIIFRFNMAKTQSIQIEPNIFASF